MKWFTIYTRELGFCTSISNRSIIIIELDIITLHTKITKASLLPMSYGCFIFMKYANKNLDVTQHKTSILWNRCQSPNTCSFSQEDSLFNNNLQVLCPLAISSLKSLYC